MRRGIVLSVFAHVFILLVSWVSFPSFFRAEPQAQVINVTLVTAPNPAVRKTEAPQPKVRTQQSAAPRTPEQPAPPKPALKKESKKAEARMVSKEKPKVVPKAKKEEKKVAEAPKSKKVEQPISRPEKLDKTRDKKAASEVKDEKAEVVSEDDFLKTLAFVEKLEIEQEEQVIAHEKGEKSDDIIEADPGEVARIKRHIEKNWYRPPGVKNLDQLSVHLEVRLNRDGTLDDLKVIKSSGQAFFDNSLLRAVRKSVPLPIPADKYDIYRIIDLHFGG